MTTRTWAIGVAATGMLALGSDATAQSGRTDNWSSTPATPGGSVASERASDHLDTMRGKVERFDRSTNTLVLSGSDTPLKVDPSARVTKDGSRASLDDIKEGDDVRASFSGSGSAMNVQRIEVTSSGAAGTPGSSGDAAGPGSRGTSSGESSPSR